MKSVIKQLEHARRRSRLFLVTRATCLLLVCSIVWVMLVMVLDSFLLLPGPVRLFLLLVGLVLLAQGLKHDIKFALHDLIQFVQSQVNTMVRDPTLGKVIGSDAIGTVARAHKVTALFRLLCRLLVLGTVEQLGL